MTMIWLMTIQQEGMLSSKIPLLPAGIMFDLTSDWMWPTSGASDVSPNLHRFNDLQRWPTVVEIHHPDGTQITTRIQPSTSHLNFAYHLRIEQGERGRIRNPWRQHIILRDVDIADVPLGSEIWGDVPDEDIKSSGKHSNNSDQ